MSKKQMIELAEQIYLEGFSEGCASMHEDYLLLKELVKAQEELIALYDGEDLTNPGWLKEDDLRNKINQLQSKTEK